MLSRYNAVDIEAALRATPPQPPFPPASDRAGWSAIRQAIGEGKAAGIIAAAAPSLAPIGPDADAERIVFDSVVHEGIVGRVGVARYEVRCR